MASFGTGLVRESVFVSELEKEFQTRLGLNRSASTSPIAGPAGSPAGPTMGHWLASLGLGDYESLFRNNGFDDLDFICGVMEEQDLKDMGIDSERDRESILAAAKVLPCKVHELNNNNNNNNNNNPSAACSTPSSTHGLETKDCGEDAAKQQGEKGEPEETEVDRWLHDIHLDIYKDTFRKHLYMDMERVRRIWEVELTAVLEIHRSGHRKRILASVSGGHGQARAGGPGPNLEDINADLNLLKSNIQQLKDEIREKLPVPSGTGTLRHSHKKSRPAPPPPTMAPPASNSGNSDNLEIRAPSELLVGVPATLTTQWRHHPHVLVSGSVNYIANYLGSTVVKELRGTESTKKSIQKLKKSSSVRDAKPTPDIILAISYRGVKFLNTITKDLVCEHEIRNIHCACQDADDLTHFAYITKDHASKSHYCHVFCVQTMDQATEVILTLGQAFEVAYQMALRDQFSGSSGSTSRNGNGHARSQSASTASLLVPPPPSTSHSRSLSVNEIKVNGQESNGSGHPEKDRITLQEGDVADSEVSVQDDAGREAKEEVKSQGSPSKGGSDSQAPLVVTEEL